MTDLTTNHMRGISLMIASATVFSLKDGFAKHLSETYAVPQLLWAQYAVLFLVVLPFILRRYGWRAVWPRHPIPQLIRGTFGVLTVGLFYLAISDIPLADATALAFVSPIVVTMLAPVLLKEKVGIRRWAAVIIGFIGILLIVQPGFQSITPGIVFGIGAGVAFALFQMTTRMLAHQEEPLVTVLYTAIVGSIAMNAILPAFWTNLTPIDATTLMIMALFAAAGQALMIYAFVAAPAVVVAPFFYTSIIVATATGYIFFGDFPNGIAWSGIAIIIGCGVYIAVRESKVKPVPA